MKGLASGLVGIMLSLLGFNLVTGTIRYSGGLLYLWEGLHIAVLFVGLFALSELVMLQAKGTGIAEVEVGRAKMSESLGGAWEALRARLQLVRGSVIGTIVGIIPGIVTLVIFCQRLAPSISAAS